LKSKVSAWNPTLNLSSTGLPQYMKGNTYHTLATSTSNDQTKASLRATLKWDLINPSRSPQIATAKDNFENARIAYSLKHRDLLLAAKIRFLKLQHSLQDIRIAEDSIKISEGVLNQSIEKMESGLGTKFDVLEANTQLSKDKQLLAEKIGNKNMNKIKLVQLLNINSNTLPEIDSTPYIVGEWKNSLEETINAAYENRKEIDTLKYKISINNNKAKLELAKTRPTVSLYNTFDGYLANGETNVSSPQIENRTTSTNNTLGIQFEWQVFDGGASKSNYKARKEKVKEIEQQVLLEKIQIRKEVEELFAKLGKAKSNIKYTYDSIQSAKESLDLSLLRQQAGFGVQREVLNSQRDLTQAEINHTKAINEYNTSLVGLRTITALEG